MTARVARAILLLAAAFGAPTANAFPIQPAPGGVAWEQFAHIQGVLDVAGPRTDGRLVVAAHGRLLLMDASGATSPYAPAYAVPDGPEPYIAISPGLTVDEAGCSFARDDVFALDLHDTPPGVTRISATGDVSLLAPVPGVTNLVGITFDTEGRFGHRLLVVGPPQEGKTAVTAIDCRGGVQPVGVVDAVMEGGIAVAPSTFGRFGGQLIAPDEKSGTIYAVSPTGTLSTVVASGVPAGPDTGVESAGFVPAAGGDAAFVADRAGQPEPHTGTDSLLRLTHDALARAGVGAGDLLVATEGGGDVVRVRCAPDCSSVLIANGPSTAHVEGRLLVVTGATYSTAPVVASTTSPSRGPAAWVIGGAVAIAVIVTGGVAWRRVHRKAD